jgi:hypothetical protein
LPKNGAKAGAGNGVSILKQLPRNFARLPVEAQLSRFEKAFTAIGRDAEGLETRERKKFEDWLFSLADDFAGEPIGHRAERLYLELETELL